MRPSSEVEISSLFGVARPTRRCDVPEGSCAWVPGSSHARRTPGGTWRRPRPPPRQWSLFHLRPPMPTVPRGSVTCCVKPGPGAGARTETAGAAPTRSCGRRHPNRGSRDGARSPSNFTSVGGEVGCPTNVGHNRSIYLTISVDRLRDCRALDVSRAKDRPPERRPMKRQASREASYRA